MLEREQSEEIEVFRRQSSGLVRSFGYLDLWIYNIFGSMIILVGFAYLYSQGPWAFPQGNMAVSILISAIWATPFFIGYALMAVTMPRSGGDYVFQSRVLHGSIGFTTMIALALSCFVWNALDGVWLSAFGLFPGLESLGLSMNNSAIVSLGTFFSTPTGYFVATLFVNIPTFFIFLSGMKIGLRIQRLGVVAAMTGVATAIIVGLSFNHVEFVTQFNLIMSKLGAPANFYQVIVSTAISHGFDPNFSFNWNQTLGLTPLVWLFLAWPMWGLINSGEIKNVQDVKKMVGSIIAALWFVATVSIVIVLELFHLVGQSFMSYIGWGFYTGGISLPIAPWYTVFLDFMTSNPIPAVLISFAIIAIAYTNNWVNYVAGSRMMLAASLDRSLPDWFGRVSTRFHQTINIGILFLIMPIVVAYLYDFTHFASYTVALSTIANVFMLFTSLALIIVPYRASMKDIWNASPASKYKLGGVPAIVLCGIAGLTFNLVMMYYEFVYANLLVNTSSGLVGLAALFLGLFVYWWIDRSYLKTKGVDIALVYREIPPM